MPQLDPSAKKARNNLLILFVTLTVLDVVLVAVSRDLWAIGRIAFTVAVMYFVLQGYRWAKWVLIGILTLVVVLLIALIVALHSKLSSFLVVGSLLMIILSIITGIFLATSQDLKRYFFIKRQANIQET